MESNQTPETKARPQAIYRAVGRIAGTYQPSAENVYPTHVKLPLLAA